MSTNWWIALKPSRLFSSGLRTITTTHVFHKFDDQLRTHNKAIMDLSGVCFAILMICQWSLISSTLQQIVPPIRTRLLSRNDMSVFKNCIHLLSISLLSVWLTFPVCHLLFSGRETGVW